MDDSRLPPEQRARVRIDRALELAGWIVQDWEEMDISAGPGVAIREFRLPGRDSADYLLFADQMAVGSVEAKKLGDTLRGVEPQAERYADGFEQLIKTKNIPRYHDRLPFHYIANGEETLFTSRLDPIRRPREVFSVHRPETLAKWATDGYEPIRQKLRHMPALQTDGMRDVQERAIRGTERSMAEDRERTLIALTMGAGKTYAAVAQTYRLLRFGGAERVLFLVDRIALGRQAEVEFLSYQSPDDGRKFSELYGVQVLRGKHIRSDVNVVISTIQRLYSVLRGEAPDDEDPDLDDVSSFELARDGRPIEVSYSAGVPIEMFDAVWVDECHRSIYGRWGQVLDYFDGFLIGLSATPTAHTYGYFHGNVVEEYDHDQSVIDGINVDYNVYRIETQVTKEGGTIETGEWVDVRDKTTRRVATHELEDEITYDAEKLDRAIVNPNQIRTIVRAFRDRVTTEIFPGRDEVPKTIVFCKHDQHAEDVLQIIWEEFGRGSEFARKVTYKTQGKVEQHIQDFRTDPAFRIAVTVDQMSTGTDIRAVECLLFLRMVGSRTQLEQMKGRGVRKIDPNEFWAVTPGAQSKGHTKDHFVIIDAVGVFDEDRAFVDSKPLDRKPSVPLRGLLQDIAMGVTDDATLSSLAARLIRLHGKLDASDKASFAEQAGASLQEIASKLRDASRYTHQVEAAEVETGKDEPSEDEVAAARSELVAQAVAELRKAPVRQVIEQLQLQTEQIIHVGGLDTLLRAEFIDTGEAEEITTTFKQFLDQHRDEYIALRAYYEQPYNRRLTLDDIRELANALEKPPLSLTRPRLWMAYEKVDASKVHGDGGRVLTDLVSLIRYALELDDELVPHSDVVKLRFDLWLAEQEQNGRAFTAAQVRWLEMFRDHIATSMTIEPEDFDLTPFNEEGGIDGAYRMFGNGLQPLIDELNMVLVAA